MPPNTASDQWGNFESAAIGGQLRPCPRSSQRSLHRRKSKNWAQFYEYLDSRQQHVVLKYSLVNAEQRKSTASTGSRTFGCGKSWQKLAVKKGGNTFCRAERVVKYH
jgi:hypothetical protein